LTSRPNLFEPLDCATLKTRRYFRPRGKRTILKQALQPAVEMLEKGETVVEIGDL
jgi:hypothetical protein